MKRERSDVEYGLEIARGIAGMDLGQTIVVRDRACVAIEAMRGTDAVIRRAGELVRGSTDGGQRSPNPIRICVSMCRWLACRRSNR